MRISLEKPSLNELAHFGVLGMKWGVHRSRKEGRVNPLQGKKSVESVATTKAKVDLDLQKTQYKNVVKKLNRETRYGLLPSSQKTSKELEQAERELNYADQDLKNARILDRLSSRKKSKTQLVLEARYKKEKGMSDDEAAVAAYKNIRTKKILAVAGVVTLAAVAGYTAYKIHDARVDKIIKSGTVIKNISGNDTQGVRDAFYASTNKLDSIKYKGLYGASIRSDGRDVFQKEVKTLVDLKQVSAKNAKNILSYLFKNDPEFSSDIKEYLTPGKSNLGFNYIVKTAKAEASLNRGIVDKNVYEVFNANLVDHSPKMQSLTNRFFNALSEKGYNAIKDVNDSKYSGYKSINPIIAFNSKGKVDVVNVRKLADSEIRKSFKIGFGHIVGTELVKQGAVITGAILGGKTVSNVSQNKANQRKVAAYRKRNPKTKLTNTEIIRMIERSQ